MIEVVERREDGETILDIVSSRWRGEMVLSRGANLCRLRHQSGAEILRTPPSMAEFRDKTETWGIPVLLPPNRIAGGVMTVGGRTYRLPVNDRLQRHHIHGLVSRQPWEVERLEDEALTLRFAHSPATASYGWFPHAFLVRLRYGFQGDAVAQTVRIVNVGAEAMPFGFGFHTAFRVPFGGTADAAQCRCRVTAGDWQWQMSPQEAIPTGRRLPLDAEEWSRGVCTEKRDVFIHAPVVERDGFCGAVLESPQERARVIYEIDRQFRYWVLWNFNGGQGFFCPEPQTWAINAPNLPYEPETTGMRMLAPGEEWSATSRIAFEECRD